VACLVWEGLALEEDVDKVRLQTGYMGKWGCIKRGVWDQDRIRD
jgi:hypothetical protein